uniref:Uncharacterized protein n=1 Tax=Rhizophora mucronata TaxID=61149 RepID=A0A2P2PML3_RHIMU
MTKGNYTFVKGKNKTLPAKGRKNCTSFNAKPKKRNAKLFGKLLCSEHPRNNWTLLPLLLK